MKDSVGMALDNRRHDCHCYVIEAREAGAVRLAHYRRVQLYRYADWIEWDIEIRC